MKKKNWMDNDLKVLIHDKINKNNYNRLLLLSPQFYIFTIVHV